jgi:hypothetical protein
VGWEPTRGVADALLFTAAGLGHGTLTWLTGETTTGEVRLSGDFEYRYCLTEESGAISGGRVQRDALIALTATEEPAHLRIQVDVDACGDEADGEDVDGDQRGVSPGGSGDPSEPGGGSGSRPECEEGEPSSLIEAFQRLGCAIDRIGTDG